MKVKILGSPFSTPIDTNNVVVIGHINGSAKRIITDEILFRSRHCQIDMLRITNSTCLILDRLDQRIFKKIVDNHQVGIQFLIRHRSILTNPHLAVTNYIHLSASILELSENTLHERDLLEIGDFTLCKTFTNFVQLLVFRKYSFPETCSKRLMVSNSQTTDMVNNRGVCLLSNNNGLKLCCGLSESFILENCRLTVNLLVLER